MQKTSDLRDTIDISTWLYTDLRCAIDISSAQYVGWATGRLLATICHPIQLHYFGCSPVFVWNCGIFHEIGLLMLMFWIVYFWVMLTIFFFAGSGKILILTKSTEITVRKSKKDPQKKKGKLNFANDVIVVAVTDHRKLEKSLRKKQPRCAAWIDITSVE